MVWNTNRITEKTLEYEDQKVNRSWESSAIKKEGREDREGKSFKDNLYKVKVKKKKILNNSHEKEEVPGEAVLISSSLSELIEENARIERIYIRKFGSNPILKNKFKYTYFKEEDLIE